MGAVGSSRTSLIWIAVITSALLTPAGLGLAATVNALNLRGRPELLHAWDLVTFGVPVTIGVLGASGFLRWLSKVVGRPIALGPVVVAGALVGLGIVISYPLDAGRIQTQLDIAAEVDGLDAPSVVEFRRRYGPDAPADFENADYVAFLNDAIDRHNRIEHERLACQQNASECRIVDFKVVRHAVLASRLGQSGGRSLFGGPLSLLAFLVIVAVGVLSRRSFIWFFRYSYLGLIAFGVLVVQGGTILYNWLIVPTPPPWIDIGGVVTSPISLGCVALGLAGYLGAVRTRLEARGGPLLGPRTLVRLLVRGLGPYWLFLGLAVVLAAIAQRDLGPAVALILVATVQIWIAFSSRRAGSILGVGLVAILMLGAVSLQLGWLAYFETGLARFEGVPSISRGTA